MSALCLYVSGLIGTFPEEPIIPLVYDSECDLNKSDKLSMCALSVLNLINSKNISKIKLLPLMKILIKL